MRVSLFNAKDPNGRRIPVTVNIKHHDKTNDFNEGDLVYLIEMSVGFLDTNGNPIDNVVICDVSQEDIKKEIGKGLALIGEKINWGDLREDTRAPVVMSVFPEPGETGVPVYSSVNVKLRDHFPFSGIDESTIKLTVNGIDVTGKLLINNEANEAKITWIPVVADND